MDQHPDIRWKQRYENFIRALQRLNETASMDLRFVSILEFEIENSDVPYVVNLIQYEQITSPTLREHIDRVGKVFYKNNETINHRRDRITG